MSSTPVQAPIAPVEGADPGMRAIVARGRALQAAPDTPRRRRRASVNLRSIGQA
jgi:hypothetical protein